jgi:hypothetical protein
LEPVSGRWSGVVSSNCHPALGCRTGCRGEVSEEEKRRAYKGSLKRWVTAAAVRMTRHMFFNALQVL